MNNDKLTQSLHELSVTTLITDTQLTLRQTSSHHQSGLRIHKSNIGKPIQAVLTNLIETDLTEIIQEVIDHNKSCKLSIEALNGEQYLLQISSYHADTFHGAELSFINVGQHQQWLEQIAQQATTRFLSHPLQ